MKARKAKKEYVQELLMAGMQSAFDMLSADGMAPETDKEYRELMDREFRRVEKLFGFEPGSFGRGV